MAKAKLIRQLVVATPNEVGTLGRLCKAIRGCGANISHFCGSALGEKARFMVAVDMPDKVKARLEKLDYEVSEVEVLEVALGNAPGTLEPVARNLAKAKVDIEYNYATTANGKRVVCILATNDNAKALKVLNRT
ncbi:MAG: hypothetical protein JXB04_08585 [Kiritimatiellae bacterium]|nr:hypothetical protein [Kiritimatiellia bacterium]